jgi:hypothetical protein
MHLPSLLSRCVSFSTGNKMPLPRHCWHVPGKYPIEKPSYQIEGLVHAHAARREATRTNDYRPVFARAVTIPGMPGIIPGMSGIGTLGDMCL